MAPATPHPRRHELQVGACRVVLVGTIQGLAGEARHVQEAWDRMGGADAILLGVPPEDVENLKRIGKEGVDAFMAQELDTGSYEESILPQLARFGDIAMPPDDLLLAERLARDAGIPLIGIDLDDQAHADLFVQEVSGFQMLRGQMRQKRMIGKVAAQATTPEELMLAWDREFTSIKGYRKVEEEREGHMAQAARTHTIGLQRVLAVLPLARMEGVAQRLGAP